MFEMGCDVAGAYMIRKGSIDLHVWLVHLAGTKSALDCCIEF